MRRIDFCFLLAVLCSISSFAADTFQFECKRSEKDYVEEYDMKVVPSTKTTKAKVFLDERDLDQSDENGTQVVKSVVISSSSILIIIDASFDPEVIQGVTYSAGSVKTQIILNRATGILKKVEDIQGGILGANLGVGVHTSEELCKQK